MAIKHQQEDPVPMMTQEQLLTARRVSQRQWESSGTDGPISMLPFTSLGEQPYTTYVNLL
jgi:hypothetical protein